MHALKQINTIECVRYLNGFDLVIDFFCFDGVVVVFDRREKNRDQLTNTKTEQNKIFYTHSYTNYSHTHEKKNMNKIKN